MDYLENIIEAIEVHSVEGIKESFRHGISPNTIFRNEPLIYELTSEYARTHGSRIVFGPLLNSDLFCLIMPYYPFY